MRPLVPQVAGVAAALALCAGFAQAQKQDPPPIGALPIETVVEQLDRNGNGCVDREEGRNYTSRRLHQMDTNKDKVLDAVEAPSGPGETTETRPISLAASAASSPPRTSGSRWTGPARSPSCPG